MDSDINKLMTKYSQLFPSEGLEYGIECSAGWTQLIDDTLACITSHENSLIDHYQYKIQHGDAQEREAYTKRLADMQLTKFAQIKSKYGSLRLYYDGGDDYVAGVTSLAERISKRTCEVCGDSGVMHTQGWWTVRCKEHN